MIEGEGPGAVTLGAEDRSRAIAAVKQALELSLDDHDALLAALAETALGLAEQFCGVMLIARDVTVMLPVACGWQRLPVAPVRAITAVAGIAEDGTRTPLPPLGYEIEIDGRDEGWVRLHDAGGRAKVAVSVHAGLAAGWDAIPGPIRQGAVMLAAYLFAERDANRPPPQAITALWRPYRGVTIGRGVLA